MKRKMGKFFGIRSFLWRSYTELLIFHYFCNRKIWFKSQQFIVTS